MTDEAARLSEKWDAHAHEWIKWVRAPSRQDSYWRFHRKRFLALVPRPGTLTVDIGCGEGRVGRDLQKLGHRVLGVDLSFAMCRAAATHSEPQPVVRADAGRLPLPDNSADCVIAFMSLQDIDDMPRALKEMARVLQDDCLLVLAIVHPMYSGGKFSKRKFSLTLRSSKQFIIKQSYFQHKFLVSTDIHAGLRVTLFREHRPLQAYTKALIGAGFNIEKLIELTDDDQARQRDGIPVFLDILARRQPRGKQANYAQEFYREDLVAAKLQSFDSDFSDENGFQPLPLAEPVGQTGHHAVRRSTQVVSGLIFSAWTGAGLIAGMAVFAGYILSR
jgi:SAM-dependent methyltransferase